MARILSLAAVISVLPFTQHFVAWTQQPEVPSLAGLYRADGTDSDGAYTGRVTVHQSRRTVLFEWEIDSPKPARYAGVGLINRDGAFVTVGYLASKELLISSAIYQIDGSTLTGEWAGGADVVYTERLTKLPPQPAGNVAR